jgi:hypothetical protein
MLLGRGDEYKSLKLAHHCHRELFFFLDNILGKLIIELNILIFKFLTDGLSKTDNIFSSLTQDG